MLGEIEAYVFNEYLKNLVFEENGEKKIFKQELDELILSFEEEKMIMHIINKMQIKVVEKNRTFKDYEELDKYLETRFIPTYIYLQRPKENNDEKASFLAIKLHHIMALKLSESELKHVMTYLSSKHIVVCNKINELDENFDYISVYNDSKLPLSCFSAGLLEKIKIYKQTNNQKIREGIIMENMNLVSYVSRKYAAYTGINKEDLESYGSEGLIMALENYDINYGSVFSNYAIAYIRDYILSGISEILLGKKDRFYHDFISAKSKIERIYGEKVSENLGLVDNIVDLLVATGKIKDSASAKEYAKRRILSLSIGNLSLNNQEEVESLLEEGLLVDAHDYAEEVMNNMTKEQIGTILDDLPTIESYVLKLRFGFLDGKPKTLKEIAEIQGLSLAEVKQIESRALTKLRSPSVKKYFPDINFDAEGYSR